MTKRLQVLLDDDELASVRSAAHRRRLTTAEWVRRSLRASLVAEQGPGAAERLEALAIASRYAFPTGDIDQMLNEIEAGYLDTVTGELS